MSATLDPADKRDMAHQLVVGARDMLARWLFQNGVLLPGQPAPELAERILLSHLAGAAFERGGLIMAEALLLDMQDQVAAIRVAGEGGAA